MSYKVICTVVLISILQLCQELALFDFLIKLSTYISNIKWKFSSVLFEITLKTHKIKLQTCREVTSKETFGIVFGLLVHW